LMWGCGGTGSARTATGSSAAAACAGRGRLCGLCSAFLGKLIGLIDTPRVAVVYQRPLQTWAFPASHGEVIRVGISERAVRKQ
jgi:hypothetical protein